MVYKPYNHHTIAHDNTSLSSSQYHHKRTHSTTQLNHTYLYNLCIATIICLYIVSYCYMSYNTGSFTGNLYYNGNNIQYNRVTNYNVQQHDTNNNYHIMSTQHTNDIQHYQYIMNGYKYMHNNNIYIVSILYNTNSLKLLQHNIDILYSSTVNLFKSYKLILVYNIDTINSDILQYIHKLTTVVDTKHIITLSVNIDVETLDNKQEEETILYNVYIDYIRQLDNHNNYNDNNDNQQNDVYSYIMTLDMNIRYGYSTDGIAHSFGLISKNDNNDNNNDNNQQQSKSTYDLICSNTLYNTGNYYDQDTLLPLYNTHLYNNNDNIDYNNNNKPSKLLPYTSMLPVHSCYGSINIYNIHTITKTQECTYKQHDHINTHILFNECITSQYNIEHIYVNSNMIVMYGVDILQLIKDNILYFLWGLLLPTVLSITIITYSYGHCIQYAMYTLGVKLHILNKDIHITHHNNVNSPKNTTSMLYMYRQLSDVQEEDNDDNTSYDSV